MSVKTVLILIVSLLLVACSKPLPPDKLNYAGEWRSEEVRLFIFSDGTVDYEKVKGSSTTTINAPIKEFKGDDFIVGVGPFDTTFEVSEPPAQVDGSWQMVVDGARLTRVSK